MNKELVALLEEMGAVDVFSGRRDSVSFSFKGVEYLIHSKADYEVAGYGSEIKCLARPSKRQTTPTRVV